MNFSEQIKSIRSTQGLTQQQFADKLCVTRQAVSNWENDKNLPDIEMIISISETFDISLDELIKGEKSGGNDLNNMTQKLIDDMGETKRAKIYFKTLIAGFASVVFGIALLVIKGLSVEYIDAGGILHENFFLLPIGFMFIFMGLTVVVVSYAIRLINYIRSRK